MCIRLDDFLFHFRIIAYDGQVHSLRNLTTNQFNGVFMSFTQTIDYFNRLHFPEMHILKTKQDIQMMPFAVYFRKHSCLKITFNSQIEAYVSGGLINFWASKFQTKFHSKTNGIEPSPLSLYQVKGVVKVCIGLFVISILVFILELMSTCHESIKNLLDFLTYNVRQRRNALIWEKDNRIS